MMERHEQALRVINERIQLHMTTLEQDGKTLNEDRKSWLREAIENLRQSKLALVMGQQNSGGRK